MVFSVHVDVFHLLGTQPARRSMSEQMREFNHPSGSSVYTGPMPDPKPCPFCKQPMINGGPCSEKDNGSGCG